MPLPNPRTGILWVRDWVQTENMQAKYAVIVGRILLYFIAYALELFLCFSIRYRWTLLVLYGFLLCRTLNVCDHEVTAVKKWGTSTVYISNYFLEYCDGILPTAKASVNAWAGVLLYIKRRYSRIEMATSFNQITTSISSFLGVIFSQASLRGA